jgi:non-specific serine/threonine protein kinase
MNADTQSAPPGALPPAAALADGHAIGVFEVQSVWRRSAHAVVYRAWDHALVRPVALKEYLPAACALRGADASVRAAGANAAAAFERGLRGFCDEARLLARCDHPSLVRVLDLIETGGTAYRVMPWYDSLTLLELRHQMAGPFGEPALRKLLGQLLGALAAFQRVGGVHRGVHPAQVLLLDEYKAMLLGPGAASRAPGNTLADTQAAWPEPGYAPPEQTRPNGQPQGPWTDFYSLAALARFCITGLPPPAGTETPEPLAAMINGLFPHQPAVRYSAELLRALDAALAPDVARRPQTVAQWRAMLGGVTADEADQAPVHSLRQVDAGTQALIQRVIDEIDEPDPRALQRPMREPTYAPRVAKRVAPTDSLADSPTDSPSGASMHAPRLDEVYEPTEPTPLAERGPPPPSITHSEPAPLHADPTDRSGPDEDHFKPPAAHRHPAVWASAVVAALVAAGLVAWGLQGQQPAGQAKVDAPAAAALEASRTEAQPSAATASAAGAALPERAVPVVAAPPAAARPAEAKPPVARPPAGPPARTAAPAATPGAAERPPATSPRQECGSRTEFALYRCMQLQCSQARWQRHPQCVRLAETDSVD